MKILRGIPVSGGYGIGKIFKYSQKNIEIKRVRISKETIEKNIEHFRETIKNIIRELGNLKLRISQNLGEEFKNLVDLQINILKDKIILEKVEERIKEGYSPEYSFTKIMDEISLPFKTSNTPFFKERTADLADIKNRVVRHLLGFPSSSILDVEENSLIIAHYIPPSEAILLQPNLVKGLAVEMGGKTSHIAIIAKSLEIPTIVGIKGIPEDIEKAEIGIIDGERGILMINPTRKKLIYYQHQKVAQEKRFASILKTHPLPITRDGKRIDISANIEFPSEVNVVKKYESGGVGLFRTEYLFFAKRGIPSEDEQFTIYKEVAEKLKPHPVIIRTFDMGGDKIVPGYSEFNPFLGWRGIRCCLDNLEFFKNQLRAIIKASAYGNVKLMFPMISTIEEIKRIKLILKNVQKELTEQNIPYDPEMEVGMMIEIPSAALLAEKFARYVNFFSIGSNDLTQYTLAVDRNNEKILSLFNEFHPAVLRLIKRVIGAGHQKGLWVGLCGELAADPLGIALLIGFGIDELSMIPSMVPEAKVIIQGLDYGITKEIAQKTVTFSTPLEVTRYLRRELSKHFPDLTPFFKKRERRICVI